MYLVAKQREQEQEHEHKHEQEQMRCGSMSSNRSIGSNIFTIRYIIALITYNYIKQSMNQSTNQSSNRSSIHI